MKNKKSIKLKIQWHSHMLFLTFAHKAKSTKKKVKKHIKYAKLILLN